MYSSFSLFWVLGFLLFIVVGVLAVVLLWLLGLGWYILPFCCVIGSFLFLYLCFALYLYLRRFSLLVCYVEQRRRESREQMLAELSEFSDDAPVPPLETPDGSGGYRTMDARSSEGVRRPRPKRHRTGRMVRRGY